MDKAKVWQSALGELEVSISKANFTTWFKNTFILDYKKGVFTVGVPTFFVEDWLNKKYLKQIIEALSKHAEGEEVIVKFKVATPPSDQVFDFGSKKVIHKPVDKPTPFKDAKPKVQSLPKNPTLNSAYFFENYVVGSSNQLAHAAAEAVSKKPGSVYNPLFIYGESGLGKTHLMQAIGNALSDRDENVRVLYVSSETFVNDFINAVEAGSGRAKDFKNRYRNVDVLLIDDIQFLSGKESTQEEFFHTFNHLHQKNKQVVLTADRVPNAIAGLENRLKTRFEGGMVADIQMPDLETREAILRQKAKKSDALVPDDVINYIATNIKSSIRELEGALTKVLATCDLKKCKPSIEAASDVLGSIIEEKRSIVTPDLIIRESCKYFGVSIENIMSRKRTKDLVIPRQVIMYLLRSEISLSFPEIGREMGGKDHTTIMHGCKKVEQEINNNLRLKNNISEIREKIRK